MTQRAPHVIVALSTLALVGSFALSGAQARAAATTAPTVPPMQMKAIHPPVLAPCPPGTGITVAPAGGRSFTAQSISFEDNRVFSDTSTETKVSHATAGRVKIVKLADASSTDLDHALTRSTAFSTVTITMRRSQGNAQNDTIVTLSDVNVVGMDVQRTGAGAQETVTLSYRQLAHTTCGG